MSTTANLGLTLIDPSQAQKEVTANAAFSALDLAITGILALNLTSTSTPMTLTLAQSTVCKMISVTGTNTAPYVIKLPAANKDFLISNGTTIALTFQVTGSSGATAVVPASTNATIYNDGTNIILLGLSALTLTVESLTDVNVTSIANAQVLTWNSSTSKWVNSAIPAQALAGLTDATVTTPSNGQVLTWNSSTSKWVNAAIPAQALSGLSDCNISSVADSQVLAYNASTSKWKNTTIGGLVASTLSGLTDVSVTEGAGIANYALVWNNGTSKWSAALLPSTLAALTDVNVTEGSGINGYILTWSNATSKWVATAPTSGITTLAGLTDVNVTEGSGINGYALTWNNSTSKWVATAMTSGSTYAGLTDVSLTSPTNNQIAVYVTADSKWENVSRPYDIGVTIESTIQASEVVLRYPFPRAVKFLATMALSHAVAGTAATSSATFTCAKNGASFATFVFASSGTVATFTCSSDTSFAAGDLLTVTGPGSADSTLADIGLSLSGLYI